MRRAGVLLWSVLVALGGGGGWALAAGAEAPPGVSWTMQQSARCTEAIGVAERGRGTAPGLLIAIARAESGRPVPPLAGLQPWPWAVNADGAAYYFDSKAAAVAWVQRALERGAQQVDVGCMQINLQSHPGAFASLDAAFEPASNAEYGARYLSQLAADAGGNWYVATGWYHSHTPVLAADYRERVAAIAEGRIPPAGLGVPLYMRAIQQGTLRIALAGGGVLRINVGRQPAGRGRRRMTACQVAAVLGDLLAPPARAACGRGSVLAARQPGLGRPVLGGRGCWGEGWTVLGRIVRRVNVAAGKARANRLTFANVWQESGLAHAGVTLCPLSVQHV